MPCRNDDSYMLETDGDDDAKDWQLCEAMTLIETNELLEECSDDLRIWWAKHRDGEVARVRGEAARKLALRERLALGIEIDGKPSKAIKSPFGAIDE